MCDQISTEVVISQVVIVVFVLVRCLKRPLLAISAIDGHCHRPLVICNLAILYLAGSYVLLDRGLTNQ